VTLLAKGELTGPRGTGSRRTVELSAAGRAGTPDQVGTVGALLIGPYGGLITGSDFLMDGGLPSTGKISPLKRATSTMIGNESNASTKGNPLLRALARWENEGGRLDAHWAERAASIQEEEHLLNCLGVAVIKCWNDLPVEVQRELFTKAASLCEPLHTTELKEQIARFLTATRICNGRLS